MRYRQAKKILMKGCRGYRHRTLQRQNRCMNRWERRHRKPLALWIPGQDGPFFGRYPIGNFGSGLQGWLTEADHPGKKSIGEFTELKFKGTLMQFDCSAVTNDEMRQVSDEYRASLDRRVFESFMASGGSVIPDGALLYEQHTWQGTSAVEIAKSAKEVIAELDKVLHGYVYGSFRTQGARINRFLFTMESFQKIESNESFVKQCCDEFAADTTSLSGIPYEVFACFEDLEKRANELRSAGDFGFRSIVEISE